MDGCFVPNLTFGPLVAQALARQCRIPLDAHLMVCDPDALVPGLAAAGVQRVAVHVEACRHLHRSLEGIRKRGMAAGVAINPATALHALEDALPFADFLLVMSVNPGFGGQSFILSRWARSAGCASCARARDRHHGRRRRRSDNAASPPPAPDSWSPARRSSAPTTARWPSRARRCAAETARDEPAPRNLALG
jgi:hypothetical protein